MPSGATAFGSWKRIPEEAVANSRALPLPIFVAALPTWQSGG